MLGPFVTAVALGATWIEITGGLPPHDDITTVQPGEHPDELWVGTHRGLVWHSTDNGDSFRIAFRPVQSEPPVVPWLSNIRASSLSDLARGTDRDLAPRDRVSLAERAGDLAGTVRDRPRSRGAPLLSSLVRRVERDRVVVKKVATCAEGVMFVVTPETVWRSKDKGVHWEKLLLGPMGLALDSQGGTPGGVGWLTCSEKTPGHVVVNTASGILESFNWGDTFGFWKNPFPRASLVQTASLGGPGGRIRIMHDNRFYREREDRNGYEFVCHLIGDSLEADDPSWVWLVADTGHAFAVTGDGILLCDQGRVRRLRDERLSRRPARFVWVDWTRAGHIYVATEHEVYESFDNGESFEQIFVSPTERTIRRILMHPDRPDDLLVVTGGQLWRRITDPAAVQTWESGAATRRRVDGVLNQAPLWEVVQTSLDRLELEPRQIAGRRQDLRLRALMPRVIVRVVRLEATTVEAYDDMLAPLATASGAEQVTQLERGHTIWSAFVLWDLRDVILDPLQTDHSWVDLERLRQRITWRVQDAWAMWARETVALGNPNLNGKQRAFHEVSRRQAAAYLHHMTGGEFAAFDLSTVHSKGASP
ncbi:hypothetical protein ACFL6C_02985 [Myxococcota bacterium]